MDGSEETDFTSRQIQHSKKLILFNDVWKIYTTLQIKILFKEEMHPIA